MVVSSLHSTPFLVGSADLFISSVNLIIFIARFTTEGRGLVKDFESFSKPGAAAAAILAMATIATFFG